MKLRTTPIETMNGDNMRAAAKSIGMLACCICALFGCTNTTEIPSDTAQNVGLTTAAVVQPNIRFGTRCQADYQNGWQATWDNNAASGRTACAACCAPAALKPAHPRQDRCIAFTSVPTVY